MNTIEQRRLELEDRIAEYSRGIIEARRELNGLLAPVCLPPELLIKIFGHFIESHNDPSIVIVLRRFAPAPPRRYGWLRAAHVCHRWREVMLGAPELWTIVWVTSSNCVSMMIDRSQQVPLTIRYRQPESCVVPPKIEEPLSLLLDQLSRVTILDLVFTAYPDVLQDRPWAAPLMKELIVRGTPRVECGATRSELPYRLLTNDMPFLEKLELHLDTVWWNESLVKPTLRHLTLHSDEKNRHRDFVIDDVLEILGQLPALETLDLQLALSFPHSLEPESPFVVLPNLRRLRLLDTAASCLELMTQLSFPVDAQMSFTCTYRTNTDVIGLLGAIRSHLGDPFTVHEAPGSSSVRSVALYGKLKDDSVTLNLKLECWPTYHPLDLLQRAIVDQDGKALHALSEPLITLELDRHGHRHLPALYLLNAIPTEATESLYLDPPSEGDTNTYSEEDTLITLLLDTPDLRELGVGDFANHCILQVLHHRDFYEEETTSVTLAEPVIRERLILPKLSVLFIDTWDKFTYPYYLSSHEKFLQGLVGLLMVRKGVSGGRMLEEFVIEGYPGVNEKEVKKAFSPYVNAVRVMHAE